MLESGKIKEAGTHKDLMEAMGRYAQLIKNFQLEQSKVRHIVLTLSLSVVLVCRSELSPSAYDIFNRQAVLKLVLKAIKYVYLRYVD